MAEIPSAARRGLLRTAVLTGLASLACGPALASQALPRNLRLIVVYPPGGVSDAAARHLADDLGRRLAIPVVVEHRPGGGGRIGLAALTRSRPDGSVLVFSAVTPLTVQSATHADADDGLRGIEPVAGVMVTPQLVVATPNFPVRTLAQAIERAHEHPGKVRWASSGIATTGHLVMEQVAAASRSKMVHVPYQGGGRQLNDALGGQFELLSTNVGPLQLRYIQSGQFTPLAVGAPARVRVLPQVPTLAEAGFPGANLSSLFGVFAAPGTPPERLDWLNAAINDVIRSPGFQERLSLADNLPADGTRQQFAQRIDADREANGLLLMQLERN